MAYPTVTGLATKLGIKLNDTTNGVWPLADKYQCINSGRRRTIMEAECHLAFVTATPALADGTHTYDCEPLTKILAVRVGDDLKKMNVDEVRQQAGSWDVREPAKPRIWVPVSGSQIRLYPTPASTTPGIIETIDDAAVAGGSGYSANDTATIDGGQTGSLAEVAIVSVSAGAAEQIRFTRDTVGNSERGKGYSSTGTTATTSTGGGTGMTVNVTALVSVKAYGVADVDDLDAGMISTLNGTPTAGGTGYSADDLLTITTGGTNGQVRVDTVSSGVVTAVSLVSAGINYTTGAGKATVGGTGGADCTVNITAITNGLAHAIEEIPVGFAETAILLAAEEEARRARPRMTGSLERAAQCNTLWLAECKKIRAAVGR